jgi:hypothetical protein
MPDTIWMNLFVKKDPRPAGLALMILIGLLFVPAAYDKTPAGNSVAGQRIPVLVELFTSEGCSSCPPADALLEKLDRAQPFQPIQVLALSEHVNYWNHLGWNYPYSSAAFSRPQEAYARQFGLSGVYTPQMVVDGSSEFVGNDALQAQAAISKAGSLPKLAVRITRAGNVDGGDGRIRVEVGQLPGNSTAAGKLGVYVAAADDTATSSVLRGENRGRTLRHVAVVRWIRQVGIVYGNAAFSNEISVSAEQHAGGLRFVAFVQELPTGRIRGAALIEAREGR